VAPAEQTGNEARGVVFGRRKGHALRKRQTALVENLLPRLRLDLASPLSDLTTLFPEPVREVWLEIGFGGGEHLAWQAARRRDVGFIGCEPFINGVAKLLAEIERQDLVNVRIHDGDAGEVLDWLPDAAVGRAFLLHPDPWPKKRHRKRRFVTAENLDRLARAMAPGAELRIASDWPDYVDWMVRRLTAHPGFAWTARCAADWRARPADWPETRYEAKAIRQGRRPVFLRFRRA
jgi:tRNA (guanine-N7-)-methyltransferase